MLADSPRGVSEEMLVVHGVSGGMLSGLLVDGLATVVTETRPGPRGLTIEVKRIRITDSGRNVLED
jgi:hypothetical protein